MIPVVYDYETKSGKDITKYGRLNHLKDPQADIVFLSYKVGGKKTKLWYPGLPVPPVFKDPKPYHFFAFNAQFDWAVTNLLGVKHGFASQNLSQQTDVMALCGRYSYPQQLAKAAEAMDLPLRKDRRGKMLMKKICAPPFKATKKEMQEFAQYCITDTEVLYLILSKLPTDRLSKDLRKKWELTVRMNLKGLPIDVPAVRRINQVIDYFLPKRMKEVAKLTNGRVKTTGQIAAIKDYCKDKGVELDNLQKATVKKVIGCDNTPRRVKELLQLRQELGGSAIKKYKTLQNLVNSWHIYDNLRFWGAGPGRYSGMGFQAQNLPRAKVADPEAEIQKFYNSTILRERPLDSAKALIRSMIKAPKGEVLMAADYKSIEYILVMWWVGDTYRVEQFRKGICPYKTEAAALTGKDYKDVTKAERTEAKPVVLGSQYFMGAKALVKYGANFGVDISQEKAEYSIRSYRSRNPLIVEAWAKLKECSLLAVSNPGEEFSFKNAHFIKLKDRAGVKWLRLKLPSGRAVFYNSPYIGEGNFGRIVKYKGINSMTKQWGTKELSPNRLIENIIQGLGWDLMTFGMLNVDPIYPVILSVHDEVIVQSKEDTADLATMINLICQKPGWAGDLPLLADGWIGKRYRKD